MLRLAASAVAGSFLDLSARAELSTATQGYTGKVSYAPGEELTLHLSSPEARLRVEIVRLGEKREMVLRQDNVRGGVLPFSPDASAMGCGWPAALSLKIPGEWRSGYYQIVLRRQPDADDPEPTDVPEPRGSPFFVLRPATPGAQTRVLMQLATNTYNAYNPWGGFSLYAYNGLGGNQGHRVSFERPPASQFGVWELPFVKWAERNGFVLDFAANQDLEERPEILQHYRLVLSLGHDEYWSAPMRDSLEAFVGKGGNVAFLSGNTCCWQVRAEEGGRALTCWKQNFQMDPVYRARKGNALLSSLWSHHLIGRPENTLTGVGFLWGGYHRSHGMLMDGSGAYTVHRPEHWLFEGTGLNRGDAFGGRDTIVGYECDGCQLEWRDGLPFPTFADGTPETFLPLGTAPAQWHPDDCEWYEQWEPGRKGHAVLGAYTRGGEVVTAGSTDWAHGLAGGDPMVVKITQNILSRLSR